MGKDYEKFWAELRAIRGLIMDLGDKVAFHGPLGEGIVYGVDFSTPGGDQFEEPFEYVSDSPKRRDGEYIDALADFYQGIDMITVIRRKADGKLFGYSWWDDISKYGESQVEPNDRDHDLQNDCPVLNPEAVALLGESEHDYDPEEYPSWYVFTPVELTTIPAARFLK